MEEKTKKKGTHPPRYDEAFKAGAIRMVTEQGREPKEVARDLGICIDTAAYASPGTGTSGTAQGPVPRPAAHVRHLGFAKRGGRKNSLRDAGALLRRVHPGHLRPCDHRRSAAGG